MSGIIKHKIGDTFSLTVTATDPDNNDAAIDITAKTITAISRPPNPVDASDKITHTVTKTDAINGVFTVTTSAADTLSWKHPVDYVTDITLVDDASGTVNSSPTFIVRTTAAVS